MTAVCRENVKVLGLAREDHGTWYLDWSASGLEFETDGGKVCAVLRGQENPDGEALEAYLGVFVDGKFYRKFRIEREKKQYILYEGAGSQRVKIRIIKLTEKQYDRIEILELHADGQICPTDGLHRKIFFIGDSITAGYGVGGKDGISVFDTKDEDVTLAYAYQAAEMVDADCRIAAWSGNGIISRWIPPEENEANVKNLMPDIFPYEQIGQPDIIVSYLGTNDASYTRGEPAREERFVKQYGIFLRRVHEACPKARMLLLCGLMESSLNESVIKAAEAEGCAYLQFMLQREEDGLGTNGHPGPVIHQNTAKLLAEQLKKMMLW